jgi:protein-disulfide isomerase
VASVVVALPIIVPSRVEAATTSVLHGGKMLKLAIAAAVATAAGTTAYVVHDQGPRGSAPAQTSVAASIAPAAETAPAAPAAAVRTTPAPPAPQLPRSQDPAAAAGAGEPAGPCEKCPKPAVPDDTVVAPETVARLGLERGPSRGPATAPVSIVVFTDVKCKYCGGALGVLDQLLDDYEGKLRIVVKQMPLQPKTEVLSEALYAAEAQGKFWELHDLMHAHQEELTKDLMFTLAQQAGLDVAQLRAALERGTYRAQLDADKAAAAELQVTGTPAFFINGHRIVGLRSAADFHVVLDRVLAEKR